MRKRLSVFFEDEQADQLAALAHETGIVVAEHIRRAIAHYLRIHADSGALADMVAAGLKNFPECQTPEDLAARLIVYWAQTTHESGVKATLRRIEAKIDAGFSGEGK
mgnify:CR=1 FL=1